MYYYNAQGMEWFTNGEKIFIFYLQFVIFLKNVYLCHYDC